MVGVGEDVAWPGEAALGQRCWQLERSLLLESLHQDALGPSHVDQADFQGPSSGGVEALRCIALAEAEQLVSLPELGPRQRAVEEPPGEFGHRRSQPGRLALDGVRRSGGIGRELGGVVVVIGGAAAPGLA